MSRTVFIDGLILAARIGVYASEQDGPQRIRIDVAFDVPDPGGVGADDLSRVVDYGAVVAAVRQIVAHGHVRLVETLAERLADAILVDERISAVRVSVAKLDILADGASAGVRIGRTRGNCPPPDFLR